MKGLKSNHDMFAVRGDRWDESKQKGYFEAERIQHVSPGKGAWSKLTARSGFFTIEGEAAAKPDPTDQGPDMDRWLKARFVSPKKQRRKASITSDRPVPRNPPAKQENGKLAYGKKAANIMAQYRAGKLAKTVTVKG